MEKDHLMKIKAIQAMRRDITLVEPNTTVEELNELMILKKHEEVVVVNDDHEIIGIITKNDLAKNLARGVEKDLPIKYIMSTNVICMKPNKDLLELRDEMRKAGVGRAPVVDEQNRILGIMTVKSICDGFSRRLEEVVGYLNEVLNHLEECIFVVDETGEIMYNNMAAQEVFDKEIRASNGNIGELLPKELSKKILKNQTYIKNMRLSKNDREYLLNTGCFQYQGDTPGILIKMRDITDIKLITEELDKTYIKLQYLQDKVQQSPSSGTSLGAIFTLNKDMQRVLEVAKRVSKTMATILITGESGTGKEVLAKAIFEDSERKDKPFITINCGAIPHNLLESELFGYEQGAFTGANKYGKTGLFELADGGTVLLDEIGELPLEMQVKLLRFLEQQSFYRVGGTTHVKVDVRIIAATNRDLQKMIKENTFREDLYYRINVIRLEIPALRHRREDLPYLINFFLEQACKFHHKKVERIDKKVLKILLDYHWPGNIRELKNIVERMVILTQDDQVMEEDLPPYLLGQVGGCFQEDLEASSEAIEKQHIILLLEKHRGNKSKVAKELQIPRSTLYYKLKMLDIP